MSTNKYGPSADEMREFATYMGEETWVKCCEHKQYGGEFMDGVSYDLKRAGYAAMLIIAELEGFGLDDGE
jgi:hypothetical protein